MNDVITDSAEFVKAFIECLKDRFEHNLLLDKLKDSCFDETRDRIKAALEEMENEAVTDLIAVIDEMAKSGNILYSEAVVNAEKFSKVTVRYVYSLGYLNGVIRRLKIDEYVSSIQLKF